MIIDAAYKNNEKELEQLVDIRNVSSPLSKSMQRSDFDPDRYLVAKPRGGKGGRRSPFRP